MKVKIIHTVNVDYQKNYFTLIILLSVIMASVILPVDFHVTLFPCLFKNTFHIPCPGCGMTRAFILLGHFHFREALTININSIFAYIMILAITMNEIAAMAIGRKMNMHLSRRGIILIYAITFCVVMTAWYYNLMNEGFI